MQTLWALTLSEHSVRLKSFERRDGEAVLASDPASLMDHLETANFSMQASRLMAEKWATCSKREL